MQKRARSLPRVTIYENGRATLSGLDYRDLRGLLTHAALHNYDAIEKAKAVHDTEAIEHAEASLALLRMAEAAIGDAISASHHPSDAPQRTGWRRPATMELRDMSKRERRRLAQEERSERAWLENMMASLGAERERSPEGT